MSKEGWELLPGVSRKWHYFGEDGRSLCGNYLILKGNLEQGNDDSVDNCAACKKKLKKLKNENT